MLFRQCIALVLHKGVERVASSPGVGLVQHPRHAAAIMAREVFGLRAIMVSIVVSMVIAVDPRWDGKMSVSLPSDLFVNLSVLAGSG